MKIIIYYGFAKNTKGNIEQMIIEIRDGKLFSKEFTGRTYETSKDAFDDVCSLNQGVSN